MLRVLAVLCALGLAGPAHASVRVFVSPFVNGGEPSYDALGVGLQSMFTTDLSQDDGVTVVERSQLDTLVDEMKLVEQGIVDPVTASRVGKALGANYVVSGAYTVIEGKMRLDAKLTEVETAKVLVAVSEEGERDAFFELEKTLVKKLLAGVGAELSPKERAAIARIHTADFDHFSEFSRGIALYQQERYDEALSVLRELSAEDSEFKLAEVTADQVEAAANRASQKAMAARVVEAESAFLVEQESARWEAAQLEALRKVAFDPDKPRMERVIAANYLFTLSGRTNTGSFHELKEVTDTFALARLGDRAYQVIWTLLDPEVPRWFPRYSGYGGSLNEERGWDAAYVLENGKRMFESSHVSQTLGDCKLAYTRLSPGGGSGWRSLGALWLPEGRALAAFHDQLRRGTKCEGIDMEHVRDTERDIAQAFLRVGEVARAAAILDRQAGEVSEADELERIARALEDVKEAAAFIEEAKTPEQKELVRFGDRVSARDLEPDNFPHALHYRLRRKINTIQNPFFLNGEPIWILSRDDGLGTGPRTAIDAANSLRHYGDTRTEFGFDREPEGPDVVVFGGQARKDGRFRVELVHTPTPEWHPHASRPAGFQRLNDAPRVGLLVGLTDVHTRTTCDPVDESKITEHPPVGIAAVLDGDSLLLARVRGAAENPRCNSYTSLGISLAKLTVVEELGRRPIRKRDGELEVKVQGNKVTAKLGRASVEATVDQPIVGFTGLWAEGDGYVELKEPAWSE